MSYYGSVDLISGLRPKNGGSFPLVNAADVYVDDNTRLPAALQHLAPAYGTKAEWQAQPDFVPAAGQIVVWKDRGTAEDSRGNTVVVPGIKIGDGNAYNLDLPYVGDDVAAQLLSLLAAHMEDTVIHITAADRQRWDNKITTSDQVSNDTLVLTRD